MPTTYEAIATVTVGSGGVNPISFTNIPQTYTDLNLVMSLRGTSSAIVESTFVRFNLDDSNSYESRALLGFGLVSSTSQTISYFQTYALSGGNSTSNTFGSTSLYIPNYTANEFKSVSVDSVAENNSGTNDQYRLAMVAATWQKTDAITRIEVYSFSGTNFAQHSTATLYGIKNT